LSVSLLGCLLVCLFGCLVDCWFVCSLMDSEAQDSESCETHKAHFCSNNKQATKKTLKYKNNHKINKATKKQWKK
jgi:predicted outer membrane lipoprotein